MCHLIVQDWSFTANLLFIYTTKLVTDINQCFVYQSDGRKRLYLHHFGIWHFQIFTSPRWFLNVWLCSEKFKRCGGLHSGTEDVRDLWPGYRRGGVVGFYGNILQMPFRCHRFFFLADSWRQIQSSTTWQATIKHLRHEWDLNKTT